MKIANNKNILPISALLLSIIFGAYLTLPTSAQTVTTTPILCDTANGDILLDDGSCFYYGSLENTLARAGTGLSVAGTLVNTLITIVVSLAFFYFFWNLVKYIRDEEGKEEAKTKMGYSLGAIFVIVTLWGLVSFLRNVLGVGRDDAAPTVSIPGVTFDEGVESTENTIQVLQDGQSNSCDGTCKRQVAGVIQQGKGPAKLPKDIRDAIRAGQKLTPEQQAEFDKVVEENLEYYSR